jgi:hypothetical protein
MKTNLLFILIFLSGCASTQITSSWRHPEASPQKIDPILVVGIMKRVDTALCRKMEEKFAIELNDLGYHAVSSTAVYGPNAFGRFNEEEPLKTLYRTRFGAVITIELMDKETVVLPPPIWLDRDADWYRRPFAIEGLQIPNGLAWTTTYVWESNYYDLGGILWLYSVNCKSYEPLSNKSLAKEYSEIVIDDMVKNRILRKQVIPLKAF